MPIEYKDSYVKMDEEYNDQIYKMFGPSLLGFPEGTDGARLQMFAQEVKQHLDILNPDVPRIQTGNERIFGKYGRAYKKLEGTWEVKDKIVKFENGVLYTLILYNPDTDTYDIIEKPIVENLTERYAFLYKTGKMDSLKVGDKICDEVIYKSTSYDDKMNYCYGKNAKVYMQSSPTVLEDAIDIRIGWLRNIMFVQSGIWQIPVSPNNVLINWYGDDDNIRVLPDIGQCAKDGILCATRPVKKENVRYDFQTDNLRKLLNIDTEYYVPENSVLCDVEVFYNGKEDFPDNAFFHQLKEFYNANCIYADRILKWTTKIKESGSKYTNNVTFYRFKYQHYNDKSYDWWKGKDKFGSILVNCKMIAIDGMDSGSKGSGRYGDKGVLARTATDPKEFEEYLDPVEVEENMKKLSELPNFIQFLAELKGIPDPTEEQLINIENSIVLKPDASMLYTDHFPVDIKLNACGAVRRENTDQLYEIEFNFCSWWVQQKVKELSSIEEKAELIFKYLRIIQEEEGDFFLRMYEAWDRVEIIDGHQVRFLNRSEQKRFVDNVEKYGFYIIKTVDSRMRYETLKRLYETFDFIQPLPMYVDIFGTKKRRVIEDGIVADKYIMFLIHNNNKNFSARSTFRVNRSELPTKDVTKRTGLSPYSRNPVRLGEYYNLMSDISGATLAEYNIPMRSSALGMRSLQRILESTGNPLAITRIKIQDNFVNANAQIAAAKLKALGIKLIFHRDDEVTSEVLKDAIMPLHVGGVTIYDTPLRKEMYVELFRDYKEFLNGMSIVEAYPGQKQDIVWKHVFGLKKYENEDSLTDDIKAMLINTTKIEHLYKMKEQNLITEEEVTEYLNKVDDSSTE